jgi:curved DNA-binding protein CbpA
MTSQSDPYKVLQVDSEAEDEVIQAAYRRLAQKYHPDVAGPDGAERMTAINAAWALLRDPARRAALDRERRADLEPPAQPGVSRPATGPDARSTPHARPSQPSAGSSAGRAPGGSPQPPPPPETVSPDWTSGRSSQGGGYDPSRMREPEGLGAAGPPPGNPVGSVLNFGRFAGWSLGEIGRRDVEYLEWLDRMTIGRPYRDEIDAILRRTGRRKSAAAEARDRPGLYRRR